MSDETRRADVMAEIRREVARRRKRDADATFTLEVPAEVFPHIDLDACARLGVGVLAVDAHGRIVDGRYSIHPGKAP
jgi:hypothetical protein